MSETLYKKIAIHLYFTPQVFKRLPALTFGSATHLAPYCSLSFFCGNFLSFSLQSKLYSGFASSSDYALASFRPAINASSAAFTFASASALNLAPFSNIDLASPSAANLASSAVLDFAFALADIRPLILQLLPLRQLVQVRFLLCPTPALETFRAPSPQCLIHMLPSLDGQSVQGTQARLRRSISLGRQTCILCPATILCCWSYRGKDSIE